MNLMLDYKYYQQISLKNNLYPMANMHSLERTVRIAKYKFELSSTRSMKSSKSKTVDLDIHRCYLVHIDPLTKSYTAERSSR